MTAHADGRTGTGLARSDVGIVTAGNEELMTWKYQGKWIYPNAGEPVFSTSSIGHKLSPEHQEIIDRSRLESIRRLEERRKRQG
jgi:hypothetical protein